MHVLMLSIQKDILNHLSILEDSSAKYSLLLSSVYKWLQE